MKPKLFNEKEVLEKVINLFWVHGFDGTSMQMLQECTQLSRASIYHSFGSKNELFRRALQQYIENIGQQYHECLNRYDNVVEALYALIKLITDTHRDPSGCLLMLSTLEIAQHEPETQDMIHAAHAQMRKLLANRLKKSGISAANSKAHLVCVFISGLLVMNKAGLPPPLEIKKMIEIIEGT